MKSFCRHSTLHPLVLPQPVGELAERHPLEVGVPAEAPRVRERRHVGPHVEDGGRPGHHGAVGDGRDQLAVAVPREQVADQSGLRNNGGRE